MTAEQVRVLFPHGLAGLHESSDSRMCVFPDADGTVCLKSGASYVLPLNDTMSSGARNANAEHAQEVLEWDPRSASFSSSFPTSKNATARTTPGTVAGDQCLLSPPSALPVCTRGNTQKKRQRSSPRQSQLHAMKGELPGYFGGNGSVDHEEEPFNTDCVGDLYVCSSQLRAEGPGKIIQDRVYEYIFLPMLAFRFIDTPEFQRLRSLKQLGTTVFLYPGATHTRFEHSIGVAHLASQMVRHIALWQPDLQITRADIICVTIAGLCHDLGHGPFSHLFERVVNRIRGENHDYRPWHHEQMSIRLLRRIASRLDLEGYGLTKKDLRFIELCIAGLAPKAPWPNDIGRPSKKRFLLDIVSNKRSGLDVDKLDYFLRDSLGCYGRAALDVHIPRLLNACRVLCHEDEFQICFEEKMALSLGDIFNVRAKLHKHAYQHRVVKITDYMVSDVLSAANPYFKIRGKDGQFIRISDCVDDEEGFCHLGDWVLNAIAASPDPNLAKAQSIIRRINDRELYALAGTAMFTRFHPSTTEQSIWNDILHFCLKGKDDQKFREAIEETLIVSFIDITFGTEDEHGIPDDPINHITFYNPKNMDFGVFKLPGARISPLFSPSEYGERHVIVMVRDRSHLELVTRALDRWRERNERNLGVAVPTSNTRKDESPGKGTALAKRRMDDPAFFENAEPPATVVPFMELEQTPENAATSVSASQEMWSDSQATHKPGKEKKKRSRTSV